MIDCIGSESCVCVAVNPQRLTKDWHWASKREKSGSRFFKVHVLQLRPASRREEQQMGIKDSRFTHVDSSTLLDSSSAGSPKNTTPTNEAMRTLSEKRNLTASHGVIG